MPSAASNTVVLASLLSSFLSLQAQPVNVTGVVSVVREGAITGKPDNGNAVIQLKPVSDPIKVQPGNGAHLPTGSRFKIVQHHKRFEPRVLAVSAGSIVDFPNFDPFFHNVFSMFDGKRFDLGLYEAGASHSVTFERPGVVYIFCNIHPEMSAVVVVTNTPYYAISDKAGNFTIANVLPGPYLVTVWHERGKLDATTGFPSQVTISGENASLPAIRLIDSGQLPVPHKNKYGHDYDLPMSPVPTYK